MRNRLLLLLLSILGNR